MILIILLISYTRSWIVLSLYLALFSFIYWCGLKSDILGITYLHLAGGLCGTVDADLHPHATKLGTSHQLA